MKYLIPALLLALPVMGQEGQSYVYVTDCSSGQPIVGATVTVQLSDTASVSTITNATGYAAFSIAPGTYGYVVDMMGYWIRYGEGRFQPGGVVATCLFRAMEGCWRVVAEILEWCGDIHAGGRGWAMLRLKNLEEGVFNITRLKMHVAGYDKPVAVYQGVVLEKVFNVTVAPPQHSVGKAFDDDSMVEVSHWGWV